LSSDRASRIDENIRRVRERIEVACARVGRDPGGVRICAVTKTVDLPEIRAAVEAGIEILGENRLQVAEPKIRDAGDLPEGVQWHFIGHLQRNKARRVVELFDTIQSLDSSALARRVSSLGEERGRRVPCLVEVKTSEEASKSGVSVEEAPHLLAEIRELAGIELQGLMTMAPFTSDEAAVRSSFSSLRSLRERLGGYAALPELSMGMTGDFELAVEEGSTLVRVGTAIFA
jgi:pyridoxal phosphate enzyme (YggS family)